MKSDPVPYKFLIADALKGHFCLDTAPEIIAFSERRLSLFYLFLMNSRQYFLKVRKQMHHAPADIALFLHDQQVQKRAREEWDALQYLYACTNTAECPINFVPPVGFVESLNGIVTERVYGTDLWRYTRSPLFRFLRTRHELFFTVGRGLGWLVQKTMRLHMVVDLSVRTTESAELDEEISRCLQPFQNQTVQASRIMNTFDIRDILVDARGQLYLMDPDVIVDTPGSRAAAQMLGTLETIGMHSAHLPTMRTVAFCEQKILQGYLHETGENPEWVLVFLVQRLPRLLRRALNKVSRQSIPRFIQRVVLVPYVRHVYYRRIGLLIRWIDRIRKEHA